MSDPVKGQCLCGNVKFSVTLKSTDVDACHCSMCRSWAAGPFMGVMTASAAVFEDETHVGVFKSSDWAERIFCKNCGSSLIWRMANDHGRGAVSAGAVDLPDDAAFTLQVFIDEKPGYYAFANQTKEMTGADLIAAFNSGEGA